MTEDISPLQPEIDKEDGAPNRLLVVTRCTPFRRVESMDIHVSSTLLTKPERKLVNGKTGSVEVTISINTTLNST